MRYYEEIIDSKTSYIYSCDMVRFNIEIRKDCAEIMSRRFSSDIRTDVNVYPIDFRPFRYRQMLTIAVGKSTVSMAVGFNGFGSSDEQLRGYIEFNPNKCFPEWKKEFLDVLSWCCIIEVARMDLAIDFPVDRLSCSLVKDGRLYEYQQKSDDDFTEYLGRRNTCGRVKLYNKAKEQKLSYPLSRLEITTECDLKEFQKHVPEVILSDVQQIDFEHADMSELSQNERVYLSLLNRLPLSERVATLKKFTYRHRRKIEKYVLLENRLEINMHCVRNVFKSVEAYTRLCA